MKPFRHFVKYWLPVVAWMSFIFIGSTDLLSGEHTSRFLIPFLRWLKPDITIEMLNMVQFVIRKLGHMTEYTILASLLWRAVGAKQPSWKRTIIALVVSAGYAALDEFHQSFVATRTASAHDVMIDICGATLALTAWYLAVRVKQRRLMT